MSPQSTYRLNRHGRLFSTRAAVGEVDGRSLVLRLLVDTGASHTVLPVEVLDALDYDTQHPLNRVRIVSANGVIVAPRVAVNWFHCLGQRVNEFPVVAHTLPTGTLVDGILGMDFLIRRQATIVIPKCEITCPVDIDADP